MYLNKRFDNVMVGTLGIILGKVLNLDIILYNSVWKHVNTTMFIL